MENKENARPYGASNGSAGTSNDDDDSDSNDGPILYRDDPQPDRAAKIARKESLSLKLALRPDRQELINRNILRLQAENDQVETKEAIGARLIRRLSMRPTAEGNLSEFEKQTAGRLMFSFPSRNVISQNSWSGTF